MGVIQNMAATRGQSQSAKGVLNNPIFLEYDSELKRNFNPTLMTLIQE